MTRVLLAFAAAAVLAVMATATPIQAAVEYRLPGNVVPRTYNLDIVPFLDDDLPDKQFTFQGQVTIRVLAVDATSSITLHSNGLTYIEEQTEVRHVGNDNALLVVSLPLETHADTQVLVVRLQQALTPGALYDLRLVFAGRLNLAMEGFYRSSYMEGDVTKWIAMTQLQPSAARRAFPCFDEPPLKARFSVRVARKEAETALSNMPCRGPPSLPDAAVGGRVWDSFEATPPMSSYLVAVVVSELTAPAPRDAAFNVWTRGEVLAHAQFAMAVGPALLANLERFLDAPCGVPKVDNVAVADFSAGAMENWGLVTYRESSLLYNEVVSTTASKQRVALVLAHEFAHFFFGDLVTPAWWEWTWLSEGFATYFQVIAVDLLYPEWQMHTQFLVDTVQPIMRTDSLLATTPLSQPCFSPAQCNANFGTITYNKGGAILRMMDHVLGRLTFQKALRSYVSKFHHRAVTPSQLFAELDSAAIEDNSLDAGVSVTAVMESWTLQAGHPYVSVSCSLPDNHPSSLVITQERVLLDQEAAEDDSLWWVPLTWTRQSDAAADWFRHTRPRAWLRREKNLLLRIDIGVDEWIVFNNQQTGFYRVAYDTHLWTLLLGALRNETELPKIDERNRAQIVDDALSLARAGALSYAHALEATVYLAQETAYAPWKAAFANFQILESRLLTAHGFAAFQRYVLATMTRLYADLGFHTPESHKPESQKAESEKAESQSRVLLRGEALKWACRYRLPDCVNHALAEFTAFQTSPQSHRVSANKKSVVYCTALRDGPSAYWSFLWHQYLATNLAAEQVTILAALGCTEDKPTLRHYLSMSVTEGSGIRRQNAASVFTAVCNNPEGVDTALEFLMQRLPDINSHYVGGGNTLGNVITGLASKLTTRAQLDKLKKFASDNEQLLATSSALAAVGKAIETAEADLRWAATNAQTILAWMELRAPDTAAAAAATAASLLLLAAAALTMYC